MSQAIEQTTFKKAFVLSTSKTYNVGDRAASDSLVYSLLGLKQYGVKVDPEPSEQYCHDNLHRDPPNYMLWRKIEDYDVVLYVITGNCDNNVTSCINFLAGRSSSLKSDCDKFVTIFLDSHRVAKSVPSFMRQSESYWLSSHSLNYEDEEFSRLCEYLIYGSCRRALTSSQQHSYETGAACML